MLLKFHREDGRLPEAEQHESQRSWKGRPSGKVLEVNLKDLRARSHKNGKRERLEPNIKGEIVLSKRKTVRREYDWSLEDAEVQSEAIYRWALSVNAKPRILGLRLKMLARQRPSAESAPNVYTEEVVNLDKRMEVMERVGGSCVRHSPPRSGPQAGAPLGLHASLFCKG